MRQEQTLLNQMKNENSEMDQEVEIGVAEESVQQGSNPAQNANPPAEDVLLELRNLKNIL